MKLKDTIKVLQETSELKEVFGVAGLLHKVNERLAWRLGVNENMRLGQKLLLAQLRRMNNY